MKFLFIFIAEKRRGDSMSKADWIMKASIILLLLATGAVALPAQTYTAIHSFDITDGAYPLAGLVQATNGSLYGVTNNGGTTSNGTVFKITTSGTLTSLHSFLGSDGSEPNAPLILATNGNLYGTTANDGPGGGGTVFRITLGGALTTLADTTASEAALVQATDGSFYGTQQGGGTHGAGTVFKVTPGGTLTTLYNFCSLGGCADGSGVIAAVIQATDGNFYGTTSTGGANQNSGTVFKITPAGVLTTLYNFCSQSGCTDGSMPHAALVQGTDGNFYGTTFSGGAVNAGTVFKITPAGTLSTLHSFDVTDGDDPAAGLIQATDGNFYGATFGGGNDEGTIFKITPSGTFTTLYSFCSQNGCTDGASSFATLFQDTNGKLYGTTETGGAHGYGTVFSLSLGLVPFVKTQTTFGAEGAAVNILGTNLTGATSVNFGGIAATFTVVSGSEITATVPVGALTGSVTVVVGATTLTSAQTFKVTPTIASFSPPSGPVGTPVTITGTGLTQTTRVTFNNKMATFTVNSDTQVTATVPTRATTGKIEITTPGGTAKSATSFTVN
jgi:uncharacterized repeat protein (TIGR03803 family)